MAMILPQRLLDIMNKRSSMMGLYQEMPATLAQNAISLAYLAMPTTRLMRYCRGT
jgi:hypothetical protein